MAKFNTTKTTEPVLNYMGGHAFAQPEKEELVFAVATTFLEDSYYESKDKKLDRIKKLIATIAEKDPLFVGKLAVITRKEFHMRSAFHLLVGELANVHRGDSIVRKTIVNGVERPDDLTEIQSYRGAKKHPKHQFEKAFREVINNFNGFQLAKYRAEGKDVSMVDLFNLCHPTPSEKNKTAFKKLMANTLKNTKTWEARLSAGEDKGKVFKELTKKKDLGYMALIRNLRNILEAGDTETIKLAAEMIGNEQAVKNSKQLPFRFLSAMEAIKDFKKSSMKFENDADYVSLIREALNKALTYSVDNLPLLEGKTAILTDNSGSMRGDCGGGSLLSAFSHRTSSDIANLFAVLSWFKSENTWIGVFGDRLLEPKLDRTKDIFSNFKIVDKAGETCGAGTETGIFKALQRMIDDRVMVNRIIIFSDCQVGTGCQWYDTSGHLRGPNFNRLMEQYRKINPNVLVYSVDLRGYGNAMFSDNAIKITGWSEKIFDLMQIIEKHGGIVKWVENYPVQLL